MSPSPGLCPPRLEHFRLGFACPTFFRVPSSIVAESGFSDLETQTTFRLDPPQVRFAVPESRSRSAG